MWYALKTWAYSSLNWREKSPWSKRCSLKTATNFPQEHKIYRKTSLSKQEWFLYLFRPARYTSHLQQSLYYLHHLYRCIVKWRFTALGCFLFLKGISTLLKLNNTSVPLLLLLVPLGQLWKSFSVHFAVPHFLLHSIRRTCTLSMITMGSLPFFSNIFQDFMTFSNELKIEPEMTTSRSGNFEYILVIFLSGLLSYLQLLKWQTFYFFLISDLCYKKVYAKNALMS